MEPGPGGPHWWGEAPERSIDFRNASGTVWTDREQGLHARRAVSPEI
jgi:hypothetical protein